ncbi:hypothetical protein HSX11_25085 [Oxalobacteraceae bacterium]|nr:hypothetical protein [Oxalobacteraceae bacterium]
MKQAILFTPLAWLLAGCATLFAPPPQPGDSEQAVLARLGQPTARYADGADTLLEYAWGGLSQFSYMARLGPDHRLRNYRQVLTSDNFATVKVGSDSKASILRKFGRPAETMYLSLPKLEVWSYRYKEADVWDSMMHVHFDHDGVVRMMMNGPDPERDEKRRWGP